MTLSIHFKTLNMIFASNTFVFSAAQRQTFVYTTMFTCLIFINFPSVAYDKSAMMIGHFYPVTDFKAWFTCYTIGNNILTQAQRPLFLKTDDGNFLLTFTFGLTNEFTLKNCEVNAREYNVYQRSHLTSRHVLLNLVPTLVWSRHFENRGRRRDCAVLFVK